MIIDKLKALPLRRLIKFGIVGGSGVVVNMAILWFATEKMELHYLISSLLAIEVSVVNNFAWNTLWTWKDRSVSGAGPVLTRFFKYNASVAIAAATNFAFLALGKEILGLHYLVANAIGIGLGFALNFILSDRWVYR